MACQNCGSSWKNQHDGTDVLKCPHCCKLARCRARKLGRWEEPVQHKACEGCGGAFVATGLSAIARRKYCNECQGKNFRRTKYLEKVKAGHTPVSRNRRVACVSCPRCGAEFKPSSNRGKYCSTKCYHKARVAGTQSWASFSHGDGASRIAEIRSRKKLKRRFVKAISEVSVELVRLVDSMRSIERDMMKLGRNSCRNCLASLEGVRRCGVGGAYCCRSCARMDVMVRSCTKCGGETFRDGLSKRPVCRRCQRKHRNKLASNNRKRCRKYGVPYDPTIKSKAVFERDGYKCHICRRQTRRDVHHSHPRYPTVDHVVPLSAGVYGHEWHNVRCACHRCNSLKSAEWDGQLMIPLGFDTPTA